MLQFYNYKILDKVYKITFAIIVFIISSHVNAFALDSIMIESLGYSGNVNEYKSIKKLHIGIMYDTLSDKAGSKSNVVMMGHRYSDKYGPKTNTLTGINKIKIDENLVVTKSNGDKYTYRVFDNFIVGPYDDWVTHDHNVDDEILTLYSCAPMWDNSYRYIVKAVRVQDASSTNQVLDSNLRNYSLQDSKKKAIFNMTTGVEPSQIYVKMGESFDVVEANKKKYKTRVYSYKDAGEYKIKDNNGSILKVIVE